MSIVLCALGQIGTEAEFHILEMRKWYRSIHRYFDPVKTDIIITNDNQDAANYSIVNKFPPETDGHFQLLGLAMGEYPIIYGHFISQISPDDCPPEPDNYIQEDYTVPVKNLPETFPENKYWMDFDIIYEGKILTASNVYLDVRAIKESTPLSNSGSRGKKQRE